uniref:Gal_mutarotas_2 domain-containing protein n=1 Tax=Macrostomum lignano TaxID=282301 RepID=A0A1I8FLT9_9PLAT
AYPNGVSALSLILLSIIALKLVDLRPNSNFDILHGWRFAGSFKACPTGDLEEQREPSEEDIYTYNLSLFLPAMCTVARVVDLPLLALLLTAASATAMQCSTSALPHNARVDCWPEIVGASESACHGAAAAGETTARQLGGSRDSPLVAQRSTFGRELGTVSLSVSAHSDASGANSNRRPVRHTSRWRLPLPLFGGDEAGAAAQQFSVRTSSSAGERFFVQVTRNSDAWPLFDTGIVDSAFGPSAVSPTTQVIYGLGEHLGPFSKPLNQWKRFVLWNRDAEPNQIETSTVRTISCWLRGSAREPPTYRTIGGILDFFVFVGPTPKDVIQQYHELLGPPMMPPLWSLGYHLCRFGFGTLDRLKFIYERNVKINIPIDGYLAYDLGLKMDNMDAYSGQQVLHCWAVWPGDVLWPDFTHPNATLYWQRSSNEFLFKYPVDGLWIDMNEPSSFLPRAPTLACPKGNPLDFPPYVPHIIATTYCTKALYVHLPSSTWAATTIFTNLYSYFEAKATWQVLRTRPDGQKDNRPEDSFAQSEHFSRHSAIRLFHWTGDNNADWYNLRYSLSTILSFNLYGIVNTGTDVCGEELCIRWTQLGAFYPFMRNHNSLGCRTRTPLRSVRLPQQIMRYHISLRYAFLPYMYTEFYRATANGSTVARSLMEEFPNDEGNLAHR